MVISVDPSPVKMKALVLAAKDSSTLVEVKIQVVVNGAVNTVSVPSTVAVNVEES